MDPHANPTEAAPRGFCQIEVQRGNRNRLKKTTEDLFKEFAYQLSNVISTERFDAVANGFERT